MVLREHTLIHLEDVVTFILEVYQSLLGRFDVLLLLDNLGSVVTGRA